MITVEDRLRAAARTLAEPDLEVPVYPELQRRVRRRRLTGFAVVVVGILAVGSVVATTRGDRERVLVANPGTSVAPTPATKRATAPIDKDRAVPIDHVGKYTWTSPAVLPFLPASFSLSYRVGGSGTAQIENTHSTLVERPGGYSMSFTFDVRSFTGSPVLEMIPSARAPSAPPRGYVLIPDVTGKTQADATKLLAEAHLAVVVAVGTGPAGLVVAESPTPGTLARVNSVITLTVGATDQNRP